MATFGNIASPTKFNGPEGFFEFLSIIFKVAGTIAGIYFVFQIIMAGFAYLSASGDEKKVTQAWAIIWQSLIGLVIVASAFVLASVVGNLFGINILNPTLSGPSN